LLRADKGAAAVLLRGKFAKPMLEEAFGFPLILFRGFEFLAGADMPRDFALLFSVCVIRQSQV